VLKKRSGGDYAKVAYFNVRNSGLRWEMPKVLYVLVKTKEPSFKGIPL